MCQDDLDSPFREVSCRGAHLVIISKCVSRLEVALIGLVLQIGKEKAKLSLFRDDMILYI